MAGDRILWTARYQAGDGDAVQAFSLGGRVDAAAIAADVPVALDGVVSSEGSVFMLDVPPGRTLFVGQKGQVGALQGDAARAVMFPLRAGTWTVAVTDEAQRVLRLLGDAAFTLKILEAGFLGGDA